MRTLIAALLFTAFSSFISYGQSNEISGKIYTDSLEVSGNVELNGLNMDNSQDQVLVSNNGLLAYRNASTIGQALPSGTIVLSDTPLNTELNNIGFQLHCGFKFEKVDTIAGIWEAISLTQAPTARRHHTAIWTGTEMIIWGGYDGSSYINSGAKYDPATDTWTTVTGTNAPSIRGRHTAVWTGTEMIIWGGTDGFNSLDDGAKYDLATDTWTAVTGTNAPSIRHLHGAVWSGTEMIIWGGYDLDNDNRLDDGAKYDPATDTWTAITNTNVPLARSEFVPVWTGTDMIVWGGTFNNTGADPDGGIYDPATDTWTIISDVNDPEQRREYIAVWANDKMLVWGGFNEESAPPVALNNGGIYDPATDTWTSISNLDAPLGRYNHSGIWTGTDLIIWAGYDDVENLNDGSMYNLASDSWTPLNDKNVPSERYWQTVVWTGELMIIWGGFGNSGELGDGATYDPYNYCPLNTHKVLFAFKKN